MCVFAALIKSASEYIFSLFIKCVESFLVYETKDFSCYGQIYLKLLRKDQTTQIKNVF